jgi:hypothetical protein
MSTVAAAFAVAERNVRFDRSILSQIATIASNKRIDLQNAMKLFTGA